MYEPCGCFEYDRVVPLIQPPLRLSSALIRRYPRINSLITCSSQIDRHNFAFFRFAVNHVSVVRIDPAFVLMVVRYLVTELCAVATYIRLLPGDLWKAV
jgi:hypothetical protein